MINNEVLKRIRYILALNEKHLLEIFEAADSPVSTGQLNSWFAKDGSTEHQKINDFELASFLNGLINFKRGKKEGAQPEAEKKLTNNSVLRKLKIAFDLKNEDVLAIIDLAGMQIGPHDLTALLRKKSHKHFRVCKDEVLISFLTGLKIKYRDMVTLDSSEEE